VPKMVRPQKAQNAPASTYSINYYELDAVEAPKILAAVRMALKMASPIVQESTSPAERLLKLLSEPSVMSMLTTVSRLPVFSHEMGFAFKALKEPAYKMLMVRLLCCEGFQCCASLICCLWLAPVW
jgi:hypothetical protein